METDFFHIDIVGNSPNQIKKNRVLQLISISLFTLSVILSFRLLARLFLPGMPEQYHEVTIIIGSCLAVNLAASLILYKYQLVLQKLEQRLEIKGDNFNNAVRNLKIEREERRRYATDLRLHEAKYRHLTGKINEGILLMDTAGNLLAANKRMEGLLGFSEAELLSMNLAQILPEEEIARTWTALEEVVQTGESNLANGWIIGKGRQKVPVDFCGVKEEYAGKTIIQGIFRDLTEPRKAGDLGKNNSPGLAQPG
jgi:PAS domain S-box-containing protein